MNRRQIVSLLGAAAVGPALMGRGAALAQTSPGRPRRVGLMVATAENDPEGKLRVETFSRSLGEAGWVDLRDVVIDVVWYRGSFPVAQTLAKDLVDRGAEILVVNGTPGMDAVRALGAPASSIPIVFVVVSNPVGAGYVPNLSRPGANITGFSTFEPEIAGKWLQLLREVTPGMQNVSMLLDKKFIGFNSLWEAVRDIAPTLGIAPHVAYASSLDEIESAVETISRQPSPGLVVSPSPINTVNRQRLIQIANEQQDTLDLSIPLLCAGGRIARLWLQCCRSIQARWHLRRPHPEGREGGRPAGAGTGPVRAWHQSQDGKCNGTDSTAVAHHRRRRDRRVADWLGLRARPA